MMKTHSLQIDLTKDKILKSILLFALPILISNFFQQLYNTVDTMIVGNFLGETSLAAIGASSSIYDLMVGFSLGVGNGMSIVVARSFGAEDEEKLKQSVAGSVVVGAFLTAAIMLAGYFGLHPLLHLLNTPDAILEESYSYIIKIALFVGVMFAYNLCAGLLCAIGNSFMPLIFLVISSVLNVCLDLLFIGQLGWGIPGAAVATVIAQGVSAGLCIVYLFKKTPLLIPKKAHFRPQASVYKELVGQGLSNGLMHAIVTSGTVVLQRSINTLGELTIAGHVTARKMNSFMLMPSVTVGAALSTFVSQNYGADKRERIIKGVKTGFLLQIGWGIIATILMILFSRYLVGLISGSGETLVLDNGSRYMIVSSPFYAVVGILFILRNSLQGLGKKILPLISSVIELAGKFVFSLVFVPMLGYTGVIICEPIIWCIMAAQLWFSFYHNPYIRCERTERVLNKCGERNGT